MLFTSRDQMADSRGHAPQTLRFHRFSKPRQHLGCVTIQLNAPNRGTAPHLNSPELFVLLRHSLGIKSGASFIIADDMRRYKGRLDAYTRQKAVSGGLAPQTKVARSIFEIAHVT
jgi:hypothetical protein